MRCIAGIVVFIVLYFGSCWLLGEMAQAVAIRNDPGHSVFAGRQAKADVLKRYHALVAVGAGTVTILGCALPTILASRRHEEWYQ
jgi:hypothetical protein